MDEIENGRLEQLFFELYEGLERCGPGTTAATSQALEQCGLRSAAPRVLDLGSGPGAQTLVLAAALPTAHIIAVDLHRPFLHRLTRRLNHRGLGHRVRAVHADMAALPFPPASCDLVWSEGAAYSIGFATALRAWRPLLADGASLAVTEATWLVPNPPAAARRWWLAEYPAIRDLPGNLELFADAGYVVTAHFPLPSEAWWEGYYLPMQRRLDDLAAAHPGDAAAATVIATAREEIDMYRQHGTSYGYTFFVAQAC